MTCTSCVRIGLTLLLVLAACLLTTPPIAAQSPENRDLEEERHFFDFLIGDWVLDDQTAVDGVVYQGNDLYSFKTALDGSAILSDWYFNRGTPEDPNYTRGMYVSAFDEMTDTWSFYYISPQNAMYYQGRKQEDNWYFYRTFNINGDEFLQRQSWTLLDDSTLIRTIENSRDEGKTWDERYIRRLKRRSH